MGRIVSPLGPWEEERKAAPPPAPGTFDRPAYMKDYRQTAQYKAANKARMQADRDKKKAAK